MNGLTPERRPDKNGTMITRWVRKEANQKSSSNKMPKVGSSPEDKLRVRRERTINHMVKALIIHGYRYDTTETKRFLSESVGVYTNISTLDIIDKALKKDASRVTEIEFIVSDYPEDKARELIYFMEYMHEDVPQDQRDALMAGLRDYERFSGVDDFSALKGEDYEAVVALIKVGGEVLAWDLTYDKEIPDTGITNKFRWHLTDSKLVEAALNNTDLVDKITDFMRERKVFDGEAILQYLKEHSALNEGFL